MFETFMKKPVPITSGLVNPILRKLSQPVEKVTSEIRDLISVMHATLKKEEGIGIAAPQVGVNLRLALAKLNSGTEKERIITMINPEIIKRSLRMESAEEGCLSLRGKWGKVSRATLLTVKFRDENWKEHVLHLDFLNARVIQHEVDHLDGILFWDRVEVSEASICESDR